MQNYRVEHLDTCDNPYCNLDSKQLLFVYNHEFWILDVPYCRFKSYYRPHEFLFDTIKKTDATSRMYKNKYTRHDRMTISDSDLKEYRLRGKRLNKWFFETCYHYFDNARKRYTITRKVSLNDKLNNSQQLEEDYRAIEQSNSLFAGLTHENRERAEKLYLDNTTFISDWEIRKSVDFIQKQMKTKINQL